MTGLLHLLLNRDLFIDKHPSRAHNLHNARAALLLMPLSLSRLYLDVTETAQKDRDRLSVNCRRLSDDGLVGSIRVIIRQHLVLSYVSAKALIIRRSPTNISC